jgi:hypothetical protein
MATDNGLNIATKGSSVVDEFGNISTDNNLKYLPMKVYKNSDGVVVTEYERDIYGYTPKLPNDISNLVGWWDCTDPLADGSSITQGQQIPIWYDKSGHGRNMTPQPGYTGPTIDLNAIGEGNKYPALSFNTTQNLRSTSFGLMSPCTVIYLARMKDSGTRRRVLGFEDNRLIGYWSNYENSLYLISDIHLTIPPAQVATNNPHIYTLTVNGTNKVFEDFHNTLSNTNSNVDTTVNFLELNSTAYTETSDCFICECIAYDRALTFLERHSLISYLQQKYRVKTQIEKVQSASFSEVHIPNNGAGGISHRYIINLKKTGRLKVWGKLNFYNSTNVGIFASIRLDTVEKTTAGYSTAHQTKEWTATSFQFEEIITTAGNHTIDYVLTTGSGMSRVSMQYELEDIE